MLSGPQKVSMDQEQREHTLPHLSKEGIRVGERRMLCCIPFLSVSQSKRTICATLHTIIKDIEL